MANGELAELYRHYPEIIKEMRDDFCSHRFILKLAQPNQRAYIEALYFYREKSDPFRTVHAQLSKQLHKFPELVRPEGPIKCTNIFGEECDCMRWTKVKQPAAR